MSELPVGAVVAGLTIQGVAGRGGMGVVYRAFDPELQRGVALKVIKADLAADPEFRERFRRESRSAAAVNHPHVIAIHRAGADRGLLFLAMQYADGTDLKELIRLRSRLDPVLATTIIGQLGSALDAAHRRGLVHRDVKPANVLVTFEGEPHSYLTDFGLTRPIDPGEQMTRTGMLMGTFEYMAPELFEGRGAGIASDVYALGCVLHHTLTGTPPFPGKDLVGLIGAHTTSPPPGLGDAVPDPGLRTALERIVAKAMDKHPEDRFPTAGALGAAARDAVRELRHAATRLREQDTGPRDEGTTKPTVGRPASPDGPGGGMGRGGSPAADPVGEVDRRAAVTQGPRAGGAVPDEPTAVVGRPRPAGPVYAPAGRPPEVGPPSPRPRPRTPVAAPDLGSAPSTWISSALPQYAAPAPPPQPVEPARRRRGRGRIAAAAVVAVLAGVGAGWWLLSGNGGQAGGTTPTTVASPTSVPATPPGGPPIVLNVPVDGPGGTTVTLAWTGPPGLPYSVVIVAAGVPTRTDPGLTSPATLTVSADTQYCFTVTGGAGLQSNVEPLRGAICAAG